jgi:hypothetical protein
MLINYDKNKMRQTNIPTLLSLLNNVVYKENENKVIFLDENARRKLLDQYNITDPVLRDALLQAAEYANQWANRYTESGGKDEIKLREVYTQNIQTVMVFLAKEWHGNIFSMAW